MRGGPEGACELDVRRTTIGSRSIRSDMRRPEQ
jgi:hypothetical protein